MPVIGRLDDQVEAVLINPLRRPPTPDEAEREQTALPTTPVGEERDGAASEEREADEGALPVWLL